MSDRLRGKIAIVTGAGSRGPGLGNGKAAAILFAREGARVLCVDQLKERAEETVGIIRGEGGEATAFAADVARAADCDGMVAEASERWGGLDILHNNVGIESRKDLVETQEDEWDRVMAVDVKSMFLATRAAVPAMEKRGGGAVICVSSIAGMRGHGRGADGDDARITPDDFVGRRCKNSRCHRDVNKERCLGLFLPLTTRWIRLCFQLGVVFPDKDSDLICHVEQLRPLLLVERDGKPPEAVQRHAPLLADLE